MNRKIIVPVLLASLAGGVVATIPHNYSVQANSVVYTDVRGGLVEINGFKSKGQVSTSYALPIVTVYDDSGVLTLGANELVVTLINPAGKNITSQISGGSFTPTTKGIYTLTYSTNIDGQIKTVTEPLKFTIGGDEYSLSLPVNSEHVIPSVIPTGTTLKIPTPTVKLGDDVQEDVVDILGPNGVKVFVVNKDNVGTNDPLDTYNEAGDYFTWQATTAGVYEIVYKYITGGTNVEDYLTQRFVVKNASEYDVNDIKLEFSYNPSRPTSAVLGVTTKLPTLNIKNKTTGNSIEGYVSIQAYSVAENGVETLVNDTMLDGFEFTPTIKGRYKFVYKASIPLFGIESATHTFYINDVRDNVNPTVFVVNNYEFDSETGEILTIYARDGVTPVYEAANYEGSTKEVKDKAITDALGNVRFDLPSVAVRNHDYNVTVDGNTVVRQGALVELPAIYAVDNFSNLTGLTFRREIRKDGSSTTIHTVSSAEFAFNETAEYLFKDDGKYSIRYVAVDAAGNERLVSFDITIYASEASLKESGSFVLPTIAMPSIASSVVTDGVLKFNKPTATDKFDSRVEVRTYYAFNNEPNVLFEITETDKDGKLVVDLDGVTIPSGATSIRVIARAYNDYAYDNVLEQREYAQQEVTVALINTDDEDAPEFVNSNTFLAQLETLNSLPDTVDAEGYLNGTEIAPFGQGDTIKLPTLQVRDLLDSRLSLSLTIKNPHNQNVSPTGLKIRQVASGGGYYNYVIEDASFKAGFAGVYTVTYTAKDSGGNIVVRTFGIRVNDTNKQSEILNVLDGVTNVEIGQVVSVPTITLVDDGILITNLGEPVSPEDKQAGVPGWYWEPEIISGNAVSSFGTHFVATMPGQFRIVYTAWDASGHELVKKSGIITATDSVKPTIVLETGYQSFFSLGVGYVANEYIVIPGVKELYDGVKDEYIQSGADQIDLVVKVTGPISTDEITVEEDAVSGGYKFVPTSGQGVYTITYTATDIYGNSTVSSHSLSVGDVQAPTLVWEDETKNVVTTAKVGDTFFLDLENKATITDDESERDDIIVVVTMRDPNGTVVNSISTTSKIYEFTKTGTYKLNIVVSDEANNSQTYSYNIEVTEDEVKTNVIEPWVGTAVIVASVLLVAGVVTYFAITNRDGSLKGGKGKKLNKTTKKRKNYKY